MAMTDADEVALLQQRLETVVRTIANLSPANFDLPNASCPDPIDFAGYRKSLYEERDMLKAMIADAAGPWELESLADT